MGKEQGTAVDKENGQVFFPLLIPKLIGFSGQTAQLVPASAAWLQLRTNVVAVDQEKVGG